MPPFLSALETLQSKVTNDLRRLRLVAIDSPHLRFIEYLLAIHTMNTSFYKLGSFHLPGLYHEDYACSFVLQTQLTRISSRVTSSRVGMPPNFEDCVGKHNPDDRAAH